MPAPKNIKWPNVGASAKLRDGRPVIYLGICPIDGVKHRLRDNRGNGEVTGTVWRLDEYGRCRGDLAPSPCDFLGAEGV